MVKISFLFKTCGQTDVTDSITQDDWEVFCKTIKSGKTQSIDFIKVGKTIFRLDELIFAKITSVTNEALDYKFVFKTNLVRRFSLKEFEALSEQFAKPSGITHLVTPTLVVSTREVVIAHHFK